MKRYAGSLRIFWLLLAMPLAASTARIYVVNGAGDTIDVIDPVTNKVVRTIDGIEAAHGLAFSPDGKTFWIDAAASNAVFVYSLPDLKLLGHVSMPFINLPGRPLGAGPQWVTFTPDSKEAYVVNPALKTVSAIDTKTLKILANVPVGEGPRNVSTLVMP